MMRRYVGAVDTNPVTGVDCQKYIEMAPQHDYFIHTASRNYMVHHGVGSAHHAVMGSPIHAPFAPKGGTIQNMVGTLLYRNGVMTGRAPALMAFRSVYGVMSQYVGHAVAAVQSNVTPNLYDVWREYTKRKRHHYLVGMNAYFDCVDTDRIRAHYAINVKNEPGKLEPDDEFGNRPANKDRGINVAVYQIPVPKSTKIVENRIPILLNQFVNRALYDVMQRTVNYNGSRVFTHGLDGYQKAANVILLCFYRYVVNFDGTAWECNFPAFREQITIECERIINASEYSEEDKAILLKALGTQVNLLNKHHNGLIACTGAAMQSGCASTAVHNAIMFVSFITVVYRHAAAIQTQIDNGMNIDAAVVSVFSGNHHYDPQYADYMVNSAGDDTGLGSNVHPRIISAACDRLSQALCFSIRVEQELEDPSYDQRLAEYQFCRSQMLYDGEGKLKLMKGTDMISRLSIDFKHLSNREALIQHYANCRLVFELMYSGVGGMEHVYLMFPDVGCFDVTRLSESFSQRKMPEILRLVRENKRYTTSQHNKAWNIRVLGAGVRNENDLIDHFKTIARSRVDYLDRFAVHRRDNAMEPPLIDTMPAPTNLVAVDICYMQPPSVRVNDLVFVPVHDNVSVEHVELPRLHPSGLYDLREEHRMMQKKHQCIDTELKVKP